jgi:uncharacterized protein YcfL
MKRGLLFLVVWILFLSACSSNNDIAATNLQETEIQTEEV